MVAMPAGEVKYTMRSLAFNQDRSGACSCVASGRWSSKLLQVQVALRSVRRRMIRCRGRVFCNSGFATEQLATL